MSNVSNLTYFGDISGLVGEDKSFAFVTRHSEGKLTSLYKIQAESNKFSEVALSFPASALFQFNKRYWIGDANENVLHSVGLSEKKTTTHKLKLPAPVTAMAAVAGERIALLCGQSVVIVDASEKSKSIQTIELEEEGTAIATNPEGDWMAVGSVTGSVTVFQAEEQDDFMLSESEAIHRGAIAALLFEPNELRFFSAGNDHKLLLTHARGRLEPEDRGRTNVHDKPISGIVHAGEDRIITGSEDKTLKSWARAGATKPQTQASDLVAVKLIATITVHNRPNLVAACSDRSLRLFLIKPDGRIGDLVSRYNDVFAKARQLFGSKDPAERGEALHDLQKIDDRAAAELLAERVTADPDNKLRLVAAQQLVKSSHNQLADLLFNFLTHSDAPVRMLALGTLEGITPDQMTLYRTALASNNADIGVHSVESLVKIATKKEVTIGDKNRAQAVLMAALDAERVEVRNAAILGLEKMFDKKSPRANLLTLETDNADAKRKGLIRLLQRGLVGQPIASAGIRRAIEDRQSPEVRQTAFLVSVLSRPDLAKVLRKRDKDLDRKLKEIEKFTFDQGEGKKPTKKKKAKVAAKADPT